MCRLPLIKKQDFNTKDISLIACSDIRSNDSEINRKNGVHFFVDDYRFCGVYNQPERSLQKYSQYAFLLSPDFSAYADMELWRQIESVAKNRWVGAYWQAKGLTVIPTISWSTPRSYEFCFDGVERNAVIAVSTLGCRKARLQFLRGYKYQPTSEECLWNYDGKTIEECWHAFLEAKIFDGKSFWEVEKEIEWIDC